MDHETVVFLFQFSLFKSAYMLCFQILWELKDYGKHWKVRLFLCNRLRRRKMD